MKRTREPELMDDPALDHRRHLVALKGLERINAVSGSAKLLWKPIRRLASELNTRSLSVLDIACGGGDVPMALEKIARRHGLSLAITGADISPRAVEYATRKAAENHSQVKFITLDALQDPFPDGFDVIVNSLFMHHLDDSEVLLLLRKMSQAAAKMVLVNDLNRSRVGTVLAYLGTRLLSRSDVVHFDGVVSMHAAYTAEELRELAARAGMNGCYTESHFPARFLLQWRKS